MKMKEMFTPEELSARMKEIRSVSTPKSQEASRAKLKAIRAAGKVGHRKPYLYVLTAQVFTETAAEDASGHKTWSDPGDLPVGAMIRKIRHETGSAFITFESSLDAGKTWFLERTRAKKHQIKLKRKEEVPMR